MVEGGNGNDATISGNQMLAIRQRQSCVAGIRATRSTMRRSYFSNGGLHQSAQNPDRLASATWSGCHDAVVNRVLWDDVDVTYFFTSNPGYGDRTFLFVTSARGSFAGVTGNATNSSDAGQLLLARQFAGGFRSERGERAIFAAARCVDENDCDPDRGRHRARDGEFQKRTRWRLPDG